MKKSIIPLLLLLSMLFLMLSACSQNNSPPKALLITANEDATLAPTAQPEPTNQSELTGIQELYKGVLRGNVEFYNVDTQEYLDIPRLWRAVTSDELPVVVKQFSVVDLEHDDIPEAILWLSMEGGGNDYVGFVILRYQDEKIYGYTLWYRAFYELKKNGTFWFSGGGGDHGFGTIAFTEKGYSIDKVTYSESGHLPNSTNGIIFFVNHESATRDEFNLAIEQQDKEEAATWYDLTDDNINTVIKQTYGNSNSITYLKINGGYTPLSYLENGAQILSGDVAPYSVLMDTELNDVPSAESLKTIEIPETHVSVSTTERDYIYGLGPIASNGDWDFYPDEVSHEVYTIESQPDQPDWVDFFKGELEESNCDGPIIITESFSFQWEGLETTVVTASNILFSAENSDKPAEEGVCRAAVQPYNDAPGIYMISAIFIQGETPAPLFTQTYEILKDQENRVWQGIGYVPWNQNYGLYTQYLSAIQYNKLGELSIFPILCNHGGELNTRNFKHLPQFAICDVDGDGQSEIVMNITRNSSIMCFYVVYKLENGVPVNALSVVRN